MKNYNLNVSRQLYEIKHFFEYAKGKNAIEVYMKQTKKPRDTGQQKERDTHQPKQEIEHHSSQFLYQIFKSNDVLQNPARAFQLVRANIRKFGQVIGNDTLNLPSSSCWKVNNQGFNPYGRVLRDLSWEFPQFQKKMMYQKIVVTLRLFALLPFHGHCWYNNIYEREVFYLMGPMYSINVKYRQKRRMRIPSDQKKY